MQCVLFIPVPTVLLLCVYRTTCNQSCTTCNFWNSRNSYNIKKYFVKADFWNIHVRNKSILIFLRISYLNYQQIYTSACHFFSPHYTVNAKFYLIENSKLTYYENQFSSKCYQHSLFSKYLEVVVDKSLQLTLLELD